MKNKIKKKIWEKIVKHFRPTFFYFFLYKSYWHFLLKKRISTAQNSNYFAAYPNVGAGIGHQLANWIAGYWFAKKFSLNFAHVSFPNNEWEFFLGFGENEIKVDSLTANKEYKKILLPLFDEDKKREVDLIQNIINSYSLQKIVFIAEQDQFYRDQFGNIQELKKKFYLSSARKYDHLIYSKDNFNIAIHIRRGDISVGQVNHNSNLLMRWQSNDYFIKLLKDIIKCLNVSKPIKIFLFSQGVRTDFLEFEEFENIEFLLEMKPIDCFLHMIFADLLVTSKSSFSYKPALLSNGVKIVPKDFWHGYPKGKDWILVDESGYFNGDYLKRAIENLYVN